MENKIDVARNFRELASYGNKNVEPMVLRILFLTIMNPEQA